jgi:hypothetical protein
MPHPINLQVCSVCGSKVERRFCHRNRAGAYICHPCQARQQGKGLLSVAVIRIRMTIPEIGRKTAILLAIGLAVVFTVAMVFLLAAD